MNNRVQKYNETYYSHAYEFERYDPPLKIVGAVASRWGPGDKFSFAKKKVMSLNLVTLGNGTFDQGNRKGKVGPGEVFIAHRGATQVFKTGDAGFLHKRSLLIEGVVLDAFMRTTGLLERDSVRPADPVRLISVFREAFRLMRDKPAGFVLGLSTLAWQALSELARSIVPAYPAPVQSAVEYMRRNLDRMLFLAEVVSVSGMSTRNFCRLFAQQTRLSPMAFFAARKMELAQSMLLNTKLSVKQVALSLGFEDQFHFSYRFKKQAGCSPLQFRQRNVKQE
jgi:AraC-like DNA-binding protein